MMVDPTRHVKHGHVHLQYHASRGLAQEDGCGDCTMESHGVPCPKRV